MAQCNNETYLKLSTSAIGLRDAISHSGDWGASLGEEVLVEVADDSVSVLTDPL